VYQLRPVIISTLRGNQLQQPDKEASNVRECNIQRNLNHCPCTYEPCSRKGICCECITYHLKMDQLPACAFPPEVERTYDRSFRRFIQTYSKR
jgi:hypothetical protein